MLGKRQTQKCPRCGAKALINQYKCPACGLVFAKLEMATNKEAAKRYKNHDRENILFVRKMPPDLKRWKLILFTVLFGLVGGHYFYTRRWWWGLVFVLGFIATILIGGVFNFVLMNGLSWGPTFVEISAFFIGIYGLWWIIDLVKVCTFRFKIPVSLPSKSEAKIGEVI